MKYIILFCISCLLLTNSNAQTGKVFDQLSMKSDILKMERNFAVYLPPDYETSTRDYPVLYLLHGAGDDQTGWVQFGEVKLIADKAIKSGKATPMIIIMPDAKTGQLGYFNSIDDSWRYEDFFFEELMPYVEQKYRIKSTKEFRAVAGLSMGGGGSFMYAMHRPELFSSACPLSAYVGPKSIDALKNQVKARGGNFSDAQLETYFNNHNAVQLAERLPAAELNAVKWYIDCGDDDFLYEGNSLIHIAFRKKEVKHEYRVRDGAHNWTYWRTALPDVLSFVSKTFHR